MKKRKLIVLLEKCLTGIGRNEMMTRGYYI